MKFTKQQRIIIKKIASGDIKDIPSFIRTFNLSKFYNFNKEDIEKRMKIDENGKKYKKLKDGVKTFYSTTSINNSLGIPMPSFHPIIPKEEDFEEAPAIISYSGSSKSIEIDESTKFEYDFFKGINITNSFKDIKDFLTIWQFLKSEGLVLEVGKKVTKVDYEVFFEYKPILDTKYGRIKAQKHEEKTGKKVDEAKVIQNGKVLNNVDLPYNFPKADMDRIKDYRNYVDYYFEYNKENELICSQFIDKQIYGNSGLDVFIKKGFKTNEEINVNKTLIPAYLALVLSLGITLWQYFNTDNSDIITIQNQLTEIQQTLYDNSPPDITEIENKLQEIYDSSSQNAAKATAPFVSTSTCSPACKRRWIKALMSFCSSGSPPVSVTL